MTFLGLARSGKCWNILILVKNWIKVNFWIKNKQKMKQQKVQIKACSEMSILEALSVPEQSNTKIKTHLLIWGFLEVILRSKTPYEWNNDNFFLLTFPFKGCRDPSEGCPGLFHPINGISRQKLKWDHQNCGQGKLSYHSCNPNRQFHLTF